MASTKQGHSIRSRLLGHVTFILFLIGLLFLLIPDYLITEKELNTDSSIVQEVLRSTYREYERHRGIVDKPCVDILLKDKPYKIQMSDESIDDRWTLLLAPKNNGQPIEYKFQKRLLDGNILHNPNQIAIGGEIIVPYDAKKFFIGWFIIAIFIGVIGFTIPAVRAFKLYNKTLLAFDKKIWKDNKWKCIRLWIRD